MHTIQYNIILLRKLSPWPDTNLDMIIELERRDAKTHHSPLLESKAHWGDEEPA